MKVKYEVRIKGKCVESFNNFNDAYYSSIMTDDNYKERKATIVKVAEERLFTASYDKTGCITDGTFTLSANKTLKNWFKKQKWD